MIVGVLQNTFLFW